MKSEVIKFCPFCGNKSPRVRLRIRFPQMSVFCDNCECFGPLAYNHEDAISEWNTMDKREASNG